MTTPAEPSGGGNVFTRKIGPLPMWGWMGIVALLAVFYYLYKKNQSASTSSTNAAANTPGGTDSSLVPQFVNQTYDNSQPPPAPNITITNNIPSSTGTTNVGNNPKYGQAGPQQKGMQAITPEEAKILMSNNNLYNTAGRAAQRPFIWNGSAYVPNTNPIGNNYQYYAGPEEVAEIAKYNKAHHPRPQPKKKHPVPVDKTMTGPINVTGGSGGAITPVGPPSG